MPSNLTHWCRNCNVHHPLHLVCTCGRAEDTPDAEVESLVCPICFTTELEELEEFGDEQ
ncbi:hypothetical protein [Pseudomonas lopnurensis]|uniref:hypothetical protein n=1 Tax=Pseudomonas lopnurensis TaxID=1477517 RepID=UPI0028AF42D5|nr:hypothetical protein [Pseudomonas lopnurensis]